MRTRVRKGVLYHTGQPTWEIWGTCNGAGPCRKAALPQELAFLRDVQSPSAVSAGGRWQGGVVAVAAAPNFWTGVGWWVVTTLGISVAPLLYMALAGHAERFAGRCP